MKRINLYDIVRGEYGSDAIYRLVTGIRRNVNFLEEAIKIIKKYRENLRSPHPVVDLESGRAYSSTDLYLLIRNKGLEMLRNYLNQLLNPLVSRVEREKKTKAVIEVDVKGLEHLVYLLMLNCETKAANLLEKFIREFF